MKHIAVETWSLRGSMAEMAVEAGKEGLDASLLSQVVATAMGLLPVHVQPSSQCHRHHHHHACMRVSVDREEWR